MSDHVYNEVRRIRRAMAEFGTVKRVVGPLIINGDTIIAVSAAMDADGNIYVSGINDAGTNLARVIKFDADGDVVWQNTSFRSAGSLCILPDGSLLFNDWTIQQLYQLDPSTGLTIKTLPFGNMARAFYDAAEPALYVSGAHQLNGYPMVAKFTWPALTLVWLLNPTTLDGAHGTTIVGIHNGVLYGYTLNYGLHTIDKTTGGYGSAISGTNFTGPVNVILDPRGFVLLSVTNGSTEGLIHKMALNGNRLGSINIMRLRKYTTNTLTPAIRMMVDANGDLVAWARQYAEDATTVYKLNTDLGFKWPIPLEIPHSMPTITPVQHHVGSSIKGVGTAITLGTHVIVM